MYLAAVIIGMFIVGVFDIKVSASDLTAVYFIYAAVILDLLTEIRGELYK